jgi:hypothetical protein
LASCFPWTIQAMDLLLQKVSPVVLGVGLDHDLVVDINTGNSPIPNIFVKPFPNAPATPANIMLQSCIIRIFCEIQQLINKLLSLHY